MSGLTNSDVAEVFGVTHAAVSRWRSGDRLPSLVSQVAIRRVLGWSLDDQGDAALAGCWAEDFETLLGERRLAIRQELARAGSRVHQGATNSPQSA